MSLVDDKLPVQSCQCPTSRRKSGLGDGLKLLVVNANAVPRVHEGERSAPKELCVVMEDGYFRGDDSAWRCTKLFSRFARRRAVVGGTWAGLVLHLDLHGRGMSVGTTGKYDSMEL